MAIDRELVLEFLRKRGSHGRDQCLHQADYELMRRILVCREFDDLEALIRFCENPSQLEPWLPNEPDQIVHAAGLCDELHHLREEEEQRGSRTLDRHAEPWFAESRGGLFGGPVGVCPSPSEYWQG